MYLSTSDVSLNSEPAKLTQILERGRTPGSGLGSPEEAHCTPNPLSKNLDNYVGVRHKPILTFDGSPHIA